MIPKVGRVAFAMACFIGLSDVHECLGRLQMAACHLGKLTAGCNSPYDWLMSLTMDFFCVICGGENDTNGCHLAGFSADVAFARHFVATRPPCQSVGVLLILATPVKTI